MRFRFSEGLTAFALLLGLVALLSATFVPRVHAVATVTPASGGSAISADTAAGAPGAAWTTLGAIVIAEGNNPDITPNQSADTFVLTLPAGFEFNTAQVPSITGASADLSALSVALTATTLTITLTSDAPANVLDTITVGATTAIRVRPTAGTPLAGGNITRDPGGPGNLSIAGAPAGNTSYGALSMGQARPRSSAW